MPIDLSRIKAIDVHVHAEISCLDPEGPVMGKIIQYANTQLGKKMLFGSDFPLIHRQKWIDAALQVGFKDEVLPGIMKDNAARLLGLV